MIAQHSARCFAGISPGSVHPTLVMLAKKGLLRRETVPGKVLYFRTGVEGHVA